ncbi:MAG TPA: hypothetical protein DDW21_05035 [Verrucomicrobiales bacterium]|nr:hypothetical protein [Verrucomicrobiales bacterium]
MNSDLLSLLHRECMNFMQVGQYEESLQILEQIRSSGFRHPAFLLDLILCCHKLRQRDRLVEYITEATLLCEHNGSQLDFLGEELQKMSLYKHALEVFRKMRSCRTDAEKAVGGAREAALHLRLSAIEDAQEALDYAESFSGSYPEVRSARAMWWMRCDPRQALPILTELAQAHPQIPFTFTAAHGHHLAHVQDQLGHYDDAFASLCRAKLLEVRHDPKIQAFQSQRTSWRAWHRDSLQFRREDACRWRNECPPSQDHAFLLGHPRSGTTLLEQVLDAHHELCSIEETNLYSLCIDAQLMAEHSSSAVTLPFSAYVHQLPENQMAIRRQNYLHHLQREQPQDPRIKVWLDKNPGLSVSVPRIAKTMPHSRLIYAQRDPRDVCISSFFQWCDRTPWSSHWLSLEDTVHQCLFTHDIWQQTKPLLEQDWMEVRYEDMIDDLESWGRKTTEFLGLEWQAQQIDHKQRAAEKVVKSPTHLAVRKDLYRHSIARWKNYEKWLQPFHDTFRPMLRDRGYES